jgi:hypothetical protein
MSQRNTECTQIMNMTVRDILTEWGQTIQGLLQDLTNTYYSPGDTDPSTSRVSLFMSTFTRGRRLFYLGLTLILIATLLLFWDQPLTPVGGGYHPGYFGHLGNLLRI